MEDVNFRSAGPLTGTYYKATAVVTGALIAVFEGYRAAATPATDAAGHVARVSVLLLLILTVMGRIGLFEKKKPQSTAAVLLPAACAMMGCCFAAAHATGNGLYLFAGFMLGIGYGVYGLIRNIDDMVAPSRLLLVTMAQVAVLFILIG